MSWLWSQSFFPPFNYILELKLPFTTKWIGKIYIIHLHFPAKWYEWLCLYSYRFSRRNKTKTFTFSSNTKTFDHIIPTNLKIKPTM